MIRLFMIVMIGGLLGGLTASAQENPSAWKDAPVNRAEGSLKGMDSAHVYAVVAVPNLGISTLRADIEEYIRARLDSVGIGSTRNLVSFPTGYITVYLFGMTRSTDADDAPDEVQFGTLMQVERFVQIRNATELSEETERAMMAATWKKHAVGFCHLDSLRQEAFEIIEPWTDTLITELRRANR